MLIDPDLKTDYWFSLSEQLLYIIAQRDDSQKVRTRQAIMQG